MGDIQGKMKCRALQILAALCFLIPASVLADGCFIPATAFEKVLIPDQRALIHFDSGNETLVIDTAFKGTGTNFAWIIPVPAEPVVEPATTGLFSTLHFLFQPKIVHDVFGFYWLEILLGLIIAYVAWRTRQGRSALGALAFVALLFLLSSMLLPSLGYGPATASGDQVNVTSRKRVGVYETATLKSLDGKAILDWLNQNGFATPTNLIPAIHSYAKEGWCFVASKIRSDALMQGAANAHPLTLKFRTQRPVYPLRLTGIDNEPCRIELYVFGPYRAEIPNFKVERCSAPFYPGTNAPTLRRITSLRIRHPLLRSLVAGSPVATKLSATLTSEQMQKDAFITWTPFREKRMTRYSDQGAAIVAANIAVPLLVAGLLGLLVGFWAREANPIRANSIRKISFMLLVAALFIWGAIFVCLPKTTVVVSQSPWVRILLLHRSVCAELMKHIDEHAQTKNGQAMIDADWVRQQLVATADFRKQLSGSLQTNLLTGELWREEDSPGNCTIRQSANGIDYVWYGIEGNENALPLISEPRKD